MKRLFFFFLPVFVLFFGTRALAYTAPNGVDYEYKFVTVDTAQSSSQNYNIFSHYPFCFSEEQKNAQGKYNLLTLCSGSSSDSGQEFLCSLSCVLGSHVPSASVVYPTTSFPLDYDMYIENYSNGGTPPYNWIIVCNPENYSDIPVLETNEAAYDYLTGASIDFEHPQYSVFVPKAKFAINYSVSPNSLNSQAYVPFNVSFYETSYYIQVSAVFHQPNNLLVSYDSNGLKYTALSSIDNTEVIVSPSDFLTYSDLNDTSSTGSTGFTRFTDLLKMSFSGVFLDSGNISFSYDGDYSQSLKDSAVSDYNSLRHVLTFGGSSVDLWVRYYSLDSDNNFVVGPWTIWKSYNPNSFTTYVPDYYQEYGKVSGTEYSTTDTSSPSDTTSPVVYNPVPTGGTASTTVNVTQNVPNYPDYPTIADYNKDNFLVNTINSITSLNAFFGDFGAFLTTSFSFLPDFIWAIIGVGFSLAIVVMFLKIL